MVNKLLLIHLFVSQFKMGCATRVTKIVHLVSNYMMVCESNKKMGIETFVLSLCRSTNPLILTVSYYNIYEEINIF